MGHPTVSARNVQLRDQTLQLLSISTDSRPAVGVSCLLQLGEGIEEIVVVSLSAENELCLVARSI